MSILNPEIEEGNIEYKRFLINLDNTRLEQLATQMKWRLNEGNNEAIYYLGVNDNGSLYQMNENEKKETFDNFNLLVNKNKSEIISSYGIKGIDLNGKTVIYFKVTIRKKNKIHPEIRVLLMGDSESGKTTFLANLLLGKVHSEKTDPRIYLLNHKHEIETKKTSSINCNYIIHNNIKYAFIEAPGLNEYNKTKYKLLLGTQPNIILLFSNYNEKINNFYKFICDNMEIPIIHVNIFNSNSDYYCKKLINKTTLFEKINKLNKVILYNNKNIKFNILNVYPHNDLGTVVSGFLVSGHLKVGQQLNWSYRDDITSCEVKSIHINSEPVKEICTNQMLTLCLSTLSNIKKMWKHGTLLNGLYESNKLDIKFQFDKNINSSDLSRSICGFCANRIVHIYNIKKSNGIFYGVILNYIKGENIIIIDFGSTKGIIKIFND